jgi:hypothetical protein
MKKVTPGRWFEIILVTTVVFSSGWYLKTVANGIDRAEQRRERSATSSSISQALLVFSATHNGANPKSISDLKIDGSADLAPFKFFADGEKIGSLGMSIFAEGPMWTGSPKSYVVYFDGGVSEE